MNDRDSDWTGAPRLRIELEREAWLAIMRAVSEDPVARGKAAEVSRAAITGDEFRDCHCLKCGDHGALYCFEEKYVSLCSRCTIERIERLAGAGKVLPPSVLWLHWEADREIRQSEKREREKLSVVFDDFYRCGRCAALVLRENARYWLPPDGGSSPPYCPPCRELLASRREDPGEVVWQPEFDFDV